MIALLIPIFMFLCSVEPAPASLVVEVTNIRSVGGTLRVAVYKPGAKFGKSRPDFYKNITVEQTGSLKVKFEIVPGTYAIALYHDKNDNDKLDKNMVGYPKEPFGFSNNFRPVVSAPDFKDCAFMLREKGTEISIKLID
jgi:uncharacterized protein (DUF2141 family)